MPNSKRWNALRQGVETLRTHFLPPVFDPLGNYADSVRIQSHTRAFLILSHAEIESYFEEWAKEIARSSENLWNSSSRVSRPLAFLLSTLAAQFKIPETIQGASKDIPQMLSDAVTTVYSRYYKQIKDNHGIKEKNLLDLFGPLGLAPAALSSTLLPSLDHLGKSRGDHAHLSAKAVQSVLDPETEYKRVRDLIVGDLATLDQWLSGYKRQVR